MRNIYSSIGGERSDQEKKKKRVDTNIGDKNKKVEKKGGPVTIGLNSLTAMASLERPLFYELLWCI